MRQQHSNVIAFPVRQARKSPTADPAPGPDDCIREAAQAGAATAEAVVAILGTQEGGSAGAESLVSSKAANAGVLWGAVVGIARCHGQIPALAALEHIVERLREDPDRLITKPQHQADEGETATAMRNLLA